MGKRFVTKRVKTNFVHDVALAIVDPGKYVLADSLKISQDNEFTYLTFELQTGSIPTPKQLSDSIKVTLE